MSSAKHSTAEYIQRSGAWTKRPTELAGELKAPATRPRSRALDSSVKQLSCFPKASLLRSASLATHSWPLRLTRALKDGCGQKPMIMWPQSRSMMWKA